MTKHEVCFFLSLTSCHLRWKKLLFVHVRSARFKTQPELRQCLYALVTSLKKKRKDKRVVFYLLFVTKNLQNNFTAVAENVRHLLEHKHVHFLLFFVLLCEVFVVLVSPRVMGYWYSLEGEHTSCSCTVFAPLQLLRNWRELRPSN
jgi:hypothetical protein